MREIPLGVDGMTLEDLVAIAREDVGVRLTKDVERRIVAARKLVE